MRVLALVAAVVALSLPVAATHRCVNDDHDATAISAGGETFYVQNDPCQPNCVFSLWVYQESNGIDGLQDGRCEIADCVGHVCPADRIIF